MVKWDPNVIICNGYDDAIKAASELAGGPVAIFSGDKFQKVLKCAMHTECNKLGQPGHKSGFRVRIYQDNDKV